jgi:phosphoenolpyruvate carboxylase
MLQTVEIVLTAHPTQVMRRSLQYKQARIGQLVQELDYAQKIGVNKEELMNALFREIMAMWQTDELRRTKPTPQEEAKANLHILEQSLWDAVPVYMRSLNSAVRSVCGKQLPLNCAPIRFASWAGGDRDGNRFVTAGVCSTAFVAAGVHSSAFVAAGVHSLATSNAYTAQGWQSCCLFSIASSSSSQVANPCIMFGTKSKLDAFRRLGRG